MRSTRTRRVQALIGAVVVTFAVLGTAGPAAADNPWNRIPAPSPSTVGNELTSVSCVSATECTAVGYYIASTGLKSLIVRTTDGLTWTRRPSPNPGAIGNTLFDVHCTTATECTAVGTYASRVQGDFPLSRSFVVRTTNGTTWQRVTSPNPFNFATVLYGVSCTSATRCRAVGEFEGNSLVLRTGNGVDWFRQETPNRGAGANHLIDIDCVDNVNCTAVGLYFAQGTESARAKTLALRTNDGRTWMIRNTPNVTAAADNDLLSVDCSTAIDCTAVGAVRPAPTNRGVIYRTTDGGASWTRAATPVRPGQVDLAGVSCQNGTTCTAVGLAWNSGGSLFGTALLRTTDGANWTSPNPASEREGRVLDSVDCLAAMQCVGVGAFNATGSGNLPLKSLVLKET